MIKEEITASERNINIIINKSNVLIVSVLDLSDPFVGFFTCLFFIVVLN